MAVEKNHVLHGFDPALTFSDSDSDDLYSVDISEIKASAEAAASAKCASNSPPSAKRASFWLTPPTVKHKHSRSSDSDDEDNIICLSDKECKTPSVLSPSLELDSIKVSGRRLVKISKKTQKIFETFEKIKFDSEKLELEALDQTPEVVVSDDDDNEEILVKVKCGKSYTKFPLKQKDPFGIIYQKLAEQHNVRFDQVVLSLNDSIIHADQTPADVGLSIIDFVECGIIRSKSKETAGKNAVSATIEGLDENIDSIRLKMQCNARRGVLYVTINKFSKMSEAMKAYAEEKGKGIADFRFMFDGEKLDPDETPLTLDLDGGECIDVYDA
ncbi:uncharacterized protein CG4449 [Hyalella azteca]|uniref:Uncharacterized protein CG4449 n=1 Tax=Hyalella azteca TaxID=294128 RepID=A0A8B7N4R3_HYAAZ|nr:uncharacterized protein CG4449 [Hyalella azteca]